MENNNLCKVLANNRGSAPGHHFVFADSLTGLTFLHNSWDFAAFTDINWNLPVLRFSGPRS